MADYSLVLVCDDEAVLSGQLRDSCPTSEQVWVRSDVIPDGTELTAGDVQALAGATVTLFALAFVFRMLRRFLIR